MTLPRPILPGSTVLITRRTTARTHLLRPDAALTQLFTYCLGVVAQRHGVAIHAAVVMSTHEHLIVTDTRGTLPRFLQELHRLVALGVKVLRKWDGPVWDHRKTSVVTLCTENSVLEKVAYLIANPVSAGLVRAAEQWPGLTTRLGDFGTGSWRAKRPDVYFAKSNESWPDEVEVQLTMPPQLTMPVAAARAYVGTALRELVAKARETLGRFKGGAPRALTKASPFARAKSAEPFRAMNPVVAVGARAGDALGAALWALREFRHAYRIALNCWRSGNRDVVFPPGTWQMKNHHGVGVAQSNRSFLDEANARCF